MPANPFNVHFGEAHIIGATENYPGVAKPDTGPDGKPLEGGRTVFKIVEAPADCFLREVPQNPVSAIQYDLAKLATVIHPDGRSGSAQRDSAALPNTNSGIQGPVLFCGGVTPGPFRIEVRIIRKDLQVGPTEYVSGNIVEPGVGQSRVGVTRAVHPSGNFGV